MSDSVNMRSWYVPVEIVTLRRWIVAAFVVNVLLLTVDYLRADSELLMLGILSCLLFAALRTSLPEVNDQTRRNIALVLSAILLGIGFYRLMITKPTMFNIWIHCWAIIPSGLSLYWLSGRPVTVWTSRNLSDSAIEYGLMRNANLSKQYDTVSTHITLLHFVAITVIPLIWIIDIAFSEGNALGGQIGDSFTTEHFSKILNGESFWTWFVNSLIVSIGTALLGLFIAIPAGYAFSRYKFTGRNASMFSFLLVQMFPGIIILVPYFLVMKTLGLLNTHLGLILAYCVTALPLCVWMLKGFFDTIPRELEEAAALDGCNQFQVFTKVVLPLSTPAIAVTALFSFLAAWNEFLLALTFNTSNDMYTLPVGLASLISSTGQAWGDFAAASLLVSLPVALLFLFFQKFLIDGLSAGGVKG
ncbi:MAG: sugar ABC transporter permease [Candidatus Poseidoniaceae archaeon]|jgi:arabinogalactan oligomer/maltooligosaccharide transport system permease protein|nr:sugar ABC transporter permease [Candidatus Poseidoniaceae archaeon]